MKIGVITEGDTEVKVLSILFPQLNQRTGNSLIRPLRLAIPPDSAPPLLIAKRCKPLVQISIARGATLIVLLLDREQRRECPGALARTLESHLAPMCPGSVSMKVVFKNRMLENWLLADTEALKAQPGRFNVTAAIEKKVSPNKADDCAALTILNDIVVKRQYDKMADGERISRKLAVERAAKNSRSLRHFLHVIGDPVFSDQCRNPAATASVGRATRRKRLPS